jgi:large subunit ribosomal protein L4
MAALTATKYDAAGRQAGSAELPQELFGGRVNQQLLYLAVKEHLDNRRQGTASTKGANEVSGGGKKPFQQKGTGRARQGSNRSSLMVGGYVAHGPHPRDYSWDLPRGMRRQSVKSALADAHKHGKMAVIESLAAPGGKTKELAALIKVLDLAGQRVLCLDRQPAQGVVRAGRNIPGLAVKAAREVNAYDLLLAGKVLVTSDGLQALQEAIGS